MRDTPPVAPRLRATMETMHAAGRRTLPPVPRRAAAVDTVRRHSHRAPPPRADRVPGRCAAAADPPGESDAAQQFVARLRSAAADFAAAAGAGSAVVREAVPPARHRRARCRVVLRYADGTETDVTFLGPAGEPGSPPGTGSTGRSGAGWATGSGGTTPGWSPIRTPPDGVAVDVSAWVAAG